jgi:hypothetical protein
MVDLNALYSHQGQEPQRLPHEISWNDGSRMVYRTGAESFTEEELEKAGYTGPYEIPTYNQEYQRFYWNSETLSYVVEDKTDEEIWEPIRRERNRLLAESDWTMVADIPGDVNLREWEIHRQRLRDLPSLYENPKDVIFPRSPECRADDDFNQPRLHEDRLLWRIRDLEGIVRNLSYRVVKPFPSWTWSDTELKWSAPVAPPVDFDESNYQWNEIDQEWITIPIKKV